MQPTSPAPAGEPAATQPHSRLVVAAAVLDCLEHPTSLLCAARSYPPALAGRFELPGGKVEPGESPQQALVRELREEISLEVRLGPELPPPPDLAPAWPALNGYRIRVWLAEPADPHHRGLAGDSHQELRWSALNQISDLDWLEADLPIVAALTNR